MRIFGRDIGRNGQAIEWATVQAPAEWRIQLRFVHQGVEWNGYTPERYETLEAAEEEATVWRDMIAEEIAGAPMWATVQGNWGGGTWSYPTRHIVGVGVMPVGMVVQKVPA